MKKYRFLINAIVAASVLAFVQGCDDDETKDPTDFSGISSTFDEGEGTRIVTIPIRNAGGSASGLSATLAGTATAGEDYEYVGITGEGVQIRIIDDNEIEDTEFVRVTLSSADGSLAGNAVHTLNITSNCEDTGGVTLSYFAGSFAATEKYGPTEDDWYGPYTIEFIQDEEDPTIFHFDNLYASGCEAYIVVDLEAGTAYFPDQDPCGVPLTNSSGTVTIDECNGSELNINLNFDGGDWLYTFRKL